MRRRSTDTKQKSTARYAVEHASSRSSRDPDTRGSRTLPRSLAAAGVAAVALLAVAVVSRAAPNTQDQGEATVYLPVVLKDWQKSQFNQERGRTPTTAPPGTATREPSPTLLPTQTALPTFTPPPAGDGEIHGKLLVNGEPGPAGLGDFGPGLLLKRCSSNDLKDCERIGRTGVYDEEGNYTFANPPGLTPGTYYVVEWRNETYDDIFGDPQWIGFWRSEPITGYSAGDVVAVPDFELGDTKLTGPSKGTGYGGLPVRFTWDTRPGESEQYHWAISEPACPAESQIYDRGDNWRSPSVGSNGAYELRSYPPNTRVGNEYRYCWFVEIQTEDNGWGWSHERWALWFFFLSFEPFGLDPMDWMVPIR